MAIAQRRMTLEEFLQLPEEEPALEFADGEVTQKVSPKMFHSAIQVAATHGLNFHALSTKLGRAFTELRTTFDGVSRVPDVVYFTWDRIPQDESGRLIEASVPPDIAIEIVSPDQSVTDLLLRCLWYVAHGVRIAILIDPDRFSIVLFRPGAEPVAIQDEGSLDMSDVIPGFSLDAEALFHALNADWSPTS